MKHCLSFVQNVLLPNFIFTCTMATFYTLLSIKYLLFYIFYFRTGQLYFVVLGYFGFVKIKQHNIG